jgi:flagellar biosynthesis/type III secretory pathway protein FliH
MFYLETKDGEKFFTDANSDDKLEFEKIIEQKLGKQTVDLFNQLIEDAKEEGYKEGYEDGLSVR